MKFLDEIRIIVSSGKGGPGCVSFRREAMVPRGGPDGGDGGRGGDVLIQTKSNMNSLVDFKSNKKYQAQNGSAGSSMNKTGADGEDLILYVPPGTLVKDDETGHVIVDMPPGSFQFNLLKGGRGGKGNTFFKTSINQAPSYAQPGESGQEMAIRLELKLIADVGIIGLPNAGKSTLISHISAAKPKIADYPFTTLIPHLGVVRRGEFRSFLVADIPGLIPGAHQGLGLGIQFLKHIERTKIFVHMLDVSGASTQSPTQDYENINFELKMYDESQKDKDGFFPLSQRKQWVAFNKIDALMAEERAQKVKEFKKNTGVTPFLISAVTGEGLEALLKSLSTVVFHEGRNEDDGPNSGEQLI